MSAGNNSIPTLLSGLTTAPLTIQGFQDINNNNPIGLKLSDIGLNTTVNQNMDPMQNMQQLNQLMNAMSGMNVPPMQQTTGQSFNDNVNRLLGQQAPSTAPPPMPDINSLLMQQPKKMNMNNMSNMMNNLQMPSVAPQQLNMPPMQQPSPMQQAPSMPSYAPAGMPPMAGDNKSDIVKHVLENPQLEDIIDRVVERKSKTHPQLYQRQMDPTHGNWQHMDRPKAAPQYVDNKTSIKPRSLTSTKTITYNGDRMKDEQKAQYKLCGYTTSLMIPHSQISNPAYSNLRGQIFKVVDIDDLPPGLKPKYSEEVDTTAWTVITKKN